MQPIEESTLTPVQYKVIQQLAGGATLDEAASSARTHRNTIANWRNTVPAFAREFARMKHELAAQYEEQLASLIPKAIQVLSTILHSDKASPSVQLRAALAVFKIMPKTESLPEPLPRPEIQQVKALPSVQGPKKPQIMHNFAQAPSLAQSRESCSDQICEKGNERFGGTPEVGLIQKLLDTESGIKGQA